MQVSLGRNVTQKDHDSDERSDERIEHIWKKCGNIEWGQSEIVQRCFRYTAQTDTRV